MISKFRLTNIIILDLPSGPVFAPSSLIPARFANLFGIFGHSGSVIVQYLHFLLFPPHFMFLCSFFFVLPFWVWYFSSFVLQSYFSYSHSWLCNLQSCFSWFCRLPACLCFCLQVQLLPALFCLVFCLLSLYLVSHPFSYFLS